ncbi:hypothetical protein Tco_1532782 [Tanacetum coccineum]
MHNNIMAVGSRDRPPMLAIGRYAQWKCILEGPYTPSTVIIPVVPATNNSPAIPERTTVETVLNMSPKNKAQFESEKEVIHLILTRIGDEIYSTVDACKTTHEMWEAIERLQQGESLNIQDVKTNLFWEFRKFTSHDGESIESYYTRFFKLVNEMIRNNLTVATMQVNVQFLQQLQPEWTRFVTIVKQQQKLDEVSYHKLFDILKQYQKEVNELRAERIAKNANPLALVATAQPYQDPYYQAPKSHKSYAPTSKASLPTRSHATTRHKGKEIAKPITPPSESASEEDSDPEQAQKDKEMQKNLALIAKYFKKIYKPTNNNLRTSSNTRNKNVDTTPRYKNDNQTGQFGNQRTMTVAGARETVGGQEAKTNLFWEFGQFTSHDGETIESYYTRFYKLMNEMIRNNLTVATMQVNVQFLQQLQPEWSRFVTIVKQQHKLDEVSYHKLFDILKQYQKEVNELRAERIAKNANPLALVATAQPYQDPYYQAPKSHKSYAPTSKASLPTKSHATTRHKGKEIAKPITPLSESASEEDSDPEQA